MNDKMYTPAELNGAVHSAMNQVVTGEYLQANAQDQAIRSRIASAISGGYDMADTLHNIYLDYGYPATLTFFNFWNMFRRFGIAKRAVTVYPDQTWLDDPIVEGTSQFDTALEKLVETHGLWRRLKGLDTRQRVGRYAGMFMRVADNLQPHEPIAGILPGEAALVDMMPLYESQLKVLSTEEDPTSPEFGQPTMYQFSTGVVGNRNEKAGTSFEIHPSRIVIAAEGSDNGGIYGVPVLESIYNDLMDLRKIFGAGGEGFYKNASQTIMFDLKDASSANANAELLNKFNDNYDSFAMDRMRKAMWTPGMEAKTLDSNLMNPKEFAMNSLMSVSAGVDTPLTMLIGTQTGRLASDQDMKGFLGQVQARRTDFGTDMVKDTIDWFIQWGILPAADYTVEWPDALAPSTEQKLTNAKEMAAVNKTVFETGQAPIFSSEEIREAAGHDPEELPEEELPDETLPDDDEVLDDED